MKHALDSKLTAADSIRVGEERSAATSEALRSLALLNALARSAAPSLPASSLQTLGPTDRASIQTPEVRHR